MAALDQRRELDQLRLRVRAWRQATSAPLLVFGVVTLAFAAYLEASNYMPVPAPLYWPLCGLLALVALWGIDRLRTGRTGVGEGRLSYARAAATLVIVVVVVMSTWWFPAAKMLLWPTTVLPVVAWRQRNKGLALRSGIVGGIVVIGWLIDAQALPGSHHPSILGGGALALVLLGLVERARERRIR